MLNFKFYSNQLGKGINMAWQSICQYMFPLSVFILFNLDKSNTEQKSTDHVYYRYHACTGCSVRAHISYTESRSVLQLVLVWFCGISLNFIQFLKSKCVNPERKSYKRRNLSQRQLRKFINYRPPAGIEPTLV